MISQFFRPWRRSHSTAVCLIVATIVALDANGQSGVRISIDDAHRIESPYPTPMLLTVSLSEPSDIPVAVRYETTDITARGEGRANTAPISIPSSGQGVPYPSTITLPGSFGTIRSVRVTLHGFTHPRPMDVSVILVGPQGQSCLLIGRMGAERPVSEVTLTFDQDGDPIPDGQLVSGIYGPTNHGSGTFSPPAPTGFVDSRLSVFNGTVAAGTWRLYVIDDTPGNGGTFAGGWSMTLWGLANSDYIPAFGRLEFPPESTSQQIRVQMFSDRNVEPAETFKVTLFDPAGAGIDDGEAIGTILNDDFTDTSLSGQSIKAAHIAELRRSINEARIVKRLSLFDFTDPTLTARSTSVSATHITELRTALAQAYAAVNASPPGYTDPAIVPGVTTAKGAHILELRAALSSLP
jgi:subtilisin-like proprotein convertase family protein